MVKKALAAFDPAFLPQGFGVGFNGFAHKQFSQKDNNVLRCKAII